MYHTKNVYNSCICCTLCRRRRFDSLLPFDKKTTTTIDTRHTHAVKTRGERITRRMKYTYKKPVGRSHSCMWSCCSVAAGFSVTGKSNYDDNGIIREERRNIERQRQRVTRLRVCIKRNNRRMVVGGWLVSFDGCKV